MKNRTLCVVRVWVSAALVGVMGAAAQEGAAGNELPVQGSSAQEFLRLVRKPFREDAWGRFSGETIYVRDGEKEKGTLELRIVFSVDRTDARLLLDGNNMYGLEQLHGEDAPPEVKVVLPLQEKGTRLSDLGITVEDLTFAFIYWDLVKEWPLDRFRGRQCRVLELKHPTQDLRARAWFSDEHYFPLKAEWFVGEDGEVLRELQLTSFKKHENGLWFMKSVRYEGPGWKTWIRFTEADLQPVDEAPIPADFLPAMGGAEIVPPHAE